MMRITLDFSPIIRNLERTADDLPQRVVQRLEPVVRDMVQEAKATHPWTNRTGTAERELWGDVEELTNGLVWLFLAHGPEVDYGWYLETRWGGRYGVIRPTLDAYLPRIRSALRGVL